jgi:hypothetical protein
MPRIYHYDKFGRTCLRIYSYSKFKGGADAVYTARTRLGTGQYFAMACTARQNLMFRQKLNLI